MQIGTDPRWAFVLEDLGPAEQALLARLGSPGGMNEEPEGAGELLTLLQRAHALAAPDTSAPGRSRSGASSRTGGGTSTDRAWRATTDSAVWSLLDPADDGALTLLARAAAVVEVHGLGRLGMCVASTLVAAGVGTLLLDDHPARTVSTDDLGVGGYRDRDLGTPRLTAATRVLLDLSPATRVSGAQGSGVTPDVVVLVAQDAVGPVRRRALAHDGTPHLAVVHGECDVRVGPLVRPGATACLTCVDLHRTDADPAWPLVAAQLAAPARAGTAPLEETLLSAVAGPLAAAQVVAVIDGRRAPAECAEIEVRLPDLLPRTRQWPVHPQCGCTGLPGASVEVEDAASRATPHR